MPEFPVAYASFRRKVNMSVNLHFPARHQLSFNVHMQASRAMFACVGEYGPCGLSNFVGMICCEEPSCLYIERY